MKKIKGMLLWSLLFTSGLSAQNVYDTYNPWNPTMDSIVGTYGWDNVVPNYIGEYQLFTNGLTPWQTYLVPLGYSISYRLESVSFPFVADCSNGDCGNASSTTRHLIMPTTLDTGDYIFEDPFDFPSDSLATMSKPAELMSNAFTQAAPASGQRDLLPHGVIKHTYYLHAGSSITDPVVDSFNFILDHTRGFMSEYPFRINNGQSSEGDHDITIIPWVVYPDIDSFLTIPAQTGNFLNTIDYFNYPNHFYYPGPNQSWNIIPNPTDTVGIHGPANYYGHPSPYSLIAVMLGNAHLGSFAGSEDTTERMGCAHTYYIDRALDFSTVNPHERIIYNPSKVFISATQPVVFPSGYTFMTVGGIYPTASQVNALDPNGMYGDPTNVPITGTALNLTNNIHTSASDAISLYEVLPGCTLRIESCVTLYDCKITIDSGAVLQYDSSTVFGDYSLVTNPGSTVQSLSNDPLVPCKYLCYEESNYNERNVTISSNTTWDTTNIESSFPGTATWSAATNNTAKFVEGITIDSGATLTVGPGVTLLFGPLAKIVVKKGGRLFVNGTSSDSCRFGPACQIEWQGIEVWGKPSLTQQTSSGYTLQGFVSAEYCVFEHARNGIVAGCLDSSGAEGGMIDVDRCSFLNNARDIVLLPYRNYSLSSVTTTVTNRSQITRSVFRTIEYFYDPLLNEPRSAHSRAAGAHISLYGVKFGTIQDCIFSTAHPETYDPHLRGTGIYAIESGFYLRPQYPCTFDNLSDGIFVQSSGLDSKVVNITGATFTNNIHGIVMEGTRFTAICQNEIDVPESPGFGYTSDALEKGYDKPVGIFMIGSVDYNIWENEFNVNDTATQLTPVTNCDNCCYDIVVYHSAIADSIVPYLGVGTGRIYKNQIHHATIGLQLQGDNGQNLSTNGVDVTCNEFDELVTYDFAAAGRSGLNPVSTTVRDQGVCDLTNSDLLATNFFLGSCSNQDQVNVGTNASSFAYVDDTNEPLCANVSLQTCVGADEHSCPSYLTWGWYYPIIEVKYNTTTTNHQNARHELDSLVDTWKNIPIIEWTSPPAYYSMFMASSPWLSDSTLLSLFTEEVRQNLSDAELVDILVANSGLSPEVYAAALNADPAIDERYMEDLEEVQGTPGVRILKEREWAMWAFQADLAAAELVTHALVNDSLEGAISTLESTTALPEMQKLFTLYLADQDTGNAELVLIDIVNAQEGKDNAWSAMAWVALDHAQEGRSWLSATHEEYQLADSIWDSNPEKEIGARSVVAYYTHERFAREPFGLESEERYGHTEEPGSTPMALAPSLQLYPNPATNTVSVVVSGNTDAEMRLEVLNALGQKVDEITVTPGMLVEIDISGYAPGMLYLRLTSQGTGLATEKLMIVR